MLSTCHRVPRVGAALLLAAVLCGCSDHVRRRFALTAVQNLPAATAILAGTSLRLELTRLEPLKSSHELVAWGRRLTGWLPLGAVSATVPTNFALPPELGSWSELEELVVSEESRGRWASAPGAAVAFRGRLGGALSLGSYGQLQSQTLAEVTAEVDIEDGRLRVTPKHLSAAVAPFRHGLLLLRTGGEHDHAAGTPRLVGTLKADGATEVTIEELVATYQEVAVTLELVNGVEQAATGSVFLKGQVPAAAGATSAPAGEGHSH
ncbi:MAG: hypothetical protein IT371_00625 [Deltaproteobacteria bacterium]|nr:hypothetical protein [Deltaproteobacteria bacterium]